MTTGKLGTIDSRLGQIVLGHIPTPGRLLASGRTVAVGRVAATPRLVASRTPVE
jgi:hypothetical protein